MFDLPMTIVAGYLGSGKTTYINQWLAGTNSARYAVLVNDFGELNIDAALIESKTARSISLTNGCICCSIANDLGAALAEVDSLSDRVDWVLMEASGVADPTRVKNQVLNSPGFQLQETITLVDVTRIQQLVRDKFVGRHIQHQLQQATRIVLSKTDLINSLQQRNIQAWLDVYRHAPDCVTGKTDLPAFYSQTIIEKKPVSRRRLRAWLEGLDSSVLRIKGFVLLEQDTKHRYLLQWVDHAWSLTVVGDGWAERATQLVLIHTGESSVQSYRLPV